MESNKANEFDEWAKQFEPTKGRCLYPVPSREQPGMAAHNVTATRRGIDGYPSCNKHSLREIRTAWKGYAAGA